MIVAQAGRPGAVTIATNMAGRGTDIVLGGNLEAELHRARSQPTKPTRRRAREEWQKRHDAVIAAGGLHIVGTERHESRRIDNQLRGRSGRQGDPGSSRFYLSLEDNLMRIFGDPERTKRWLQTAGMKEGEVIESRMLSKQIESAQRKVEAHNFDARKNLLEYDDVANDQRKVIYQQRTELMDAEDVADAVAGIRHEVVEHDHRSLRAAEAASKSMWDIEGLNAGDRARLRACASTPRAGSKPTRTWPKTACASGSSRSSIDAYEAKVQQYGAPVVRHDREGDHAAAARPALARAPGRDGLPAPGHPPAQLRAEESEAGIQARGVRAVHRDARSDQARHGFAAVADAAAHAGGDRCGGRGASAPPRARDAVPACRARADYRAAAPQGPVAEPQQRGAQPSRSRSSCARRKKVGRNEPCPCGSGKKYKHCHGALREG